MSSEWIIGALAIVTLAIVLGLAVFNFGFFLRKPRNRKAAYDAAFADESVTTREQREAAPGSFEKTPIRDRVDHPRVPTASD